MPASFRSPLFRIVALLCVTSLLTCTYLVYHYIDLQRESTERARATVVDQARKAASEIGDRKGIIKPLVEKLAGELSSGTINREQLAGHLQNLYTEHAATIFEIGVAYQPGTPCTTEKMDGPHYGEKAGSTGHFNIENYYSSPYLDWPWYRNTITDSPGWFEPYLGGATGQLAVGFASPFYCPEAAGARREPAGVVRANLSLTDIRERLGEVELGKTGFGFILSGKGVFIAHPVASYSYALESAFDLEDEALQGFVRRGLAGEDEPFDYTDPGSGQDSWLVLTPIPGTSWSLGAVFFKSEAKDSVTTSRQLLIRITIAVTAFLSTLLFLASGAYAGGTRALWLGGSTATALLLLAAVVAVCALALRMPSERAGLGVKVTGPAAASKFLNNNAVRQRDQLVHAEEPVYIPTGVFVQSIEFSSANNVILTGYVWQKYADTVAHDVSRAFVFPEAESAEISKAYSRPYDGGTVMGWYFRATLRQTFDYFAYPLDQQDVWIRVWHKDFDRNVILTPDFSSYDYRNPILLPGLDKTDFVLPGWTIGQTYFSFRENSYNSNFGIDNYVGQREFPELYFNIRLVRKFIDPFISNIIPLTAIAMMLFAVLVYGTQGGTESVDLGFDGSTVLSIAAAFFFTVLIAHVNLRSSLNSEKVVYLEYFYLIMYVAILSVSLNSLLFSGHRGATMLRGMIQAQDNLWPKLFYWPVIMTLLFAITVYVFY